MDLQLFVSLHKPFPVPEDPLLVPIQVGAALAPGPLDGCLRDDTGESISSQNRSYCELTAQYWVWKNAKADYVGFFHYRRYLYPAPAARRPYRVECLPDVQLLERLGWVRLPELIRGYDLIAPIGEDMHLSVREHYAKAPFHHGKDLALVEEIIRERTPDYVDAMDAYLSQSICYFGNIYIMAWPLFERYCQWLFPILEEFDRRSDLAGYGPQELRVDGYLAERLFGVFYTKVKAEGLRTLELPRVHFVESRGQTVKQRFINALLPPGSVRRSKIKKLKG